MTSETYYDLLGVAEGADAATIKRAYRKLAVTAHPDKSAEPDAGERFRRIVEAYDALKEEGSREAYDALLALQRCGAAPSELPDLDDALREHSDWFGGGEPGELPDWMSGAAAAFARENNDVRARLELTLEALWSGEQQRVRYTRRVRCPCPQSACAACLFKGRVPTECHVDVDLAHAPASPHTLSYPGLGDEARDASQPTGALLVDVVALPHGLYRLEAPRRVAYEKRVAVDELQRAGEAYCFLLPALGGGARWRFKVALPLDWDARYTGKLPHPGGLDWHIALRFLTMTPRGASARSEPEDTPTLPPILLRREA